MAVRTLRPITRGNLRIAEYVDDLRKALKGDNDTVEDNYTLRANDAVTPTLTVENEAANSVAQEWYVGGQLVASIGAGGILTGLTQVTNALGISGVSANGIVDCYAALQAALDAMYAAGGGVLYFPKGTYRSSKALRVYADTTLQGDGMGATTLLFDDVTDLALAATTVGTDAWGDLYYGIRIGTPFCAFADAISLHTTTTIAAGDRRVRLNTNGDTSFFAVGDVVQLFASQATYLPESGASWASSPMGVLTTRILDKETVSSNNYLWLEDSIPWTYTQPNALPKLRYRQFAANPATYKNADRATVRDLTISVGDGAGTEQAVGARNRAQGISIGGVEDVHVERVRVTRFRYRGVSIGATRSFKLTNSVIDQIVSSRTTADGGSDGCAVDGYYDFAPLIQGNTFKRSGWGVALNTATYAKVIDNHVTGRSGVYEPAVLLNPTGNKTAGVDPDGDSADADDLGWKYSGRGIKFQLACHGGEIRGNTIADTTLVGIYYTDSAWGLIADNEIMSVGVDAIAENGIISTEQLSGNTHHVTIARNKILRPRAYGIVIGQGQNTSQTAIKVIDNTVSGAGQNGIYAEQIMGAIVARNSIDGCAGPAINLTTDATRIVVTGNVIDNSAGGAISTTNSDGGNLIGDNLFLAGSISLHASDAPQANDGLVVNSTAVTAAAWTNVVRSTDSTPHRVSLYSHGNPVEVLWTGAVTTTSTNGLLGISLDGATPSAQATVPGSSTLRQTAMVASFTPAAGLHTYTVMAFCETGGQSVTVPGGSNVAVLMAREVRR